MQKPVVLRESLPDAEKIDMRRIMDCLLIALVKKNGAKVEISVADLDAADDMLTMTLNEDGSAFIVETVRRQ